MQRAYVVRGKLTGPKSIELAEAVDGVEVEVEVIVREVRRAVPPPEDTESPVAIMRRDVVAAALARKPPELEVVYERDEPDASTDTGMIVARRKTGVPAAKSDDDEDTNPELAAVVPSQPPPRS